jgi:hypothetical protein
MRLWPHAPTVHHAALQCLVALCKDNTMMKAHITVTALPAILASLESHPSSGPVTERGFTLLGVLQSGGDHLNDGIRRLQTEAGLIECASRALQRHSHGEEAALAAVCFAVAMVLRGGERWRATVKWRAARSELLPSLSQAEQVCALWWL